MQPDPDPAAPPYARWGEMPLSWTEEQRTAVGAALDDIAAWARRNYEAHQAEPAEGSSSEDAAP